MVEDWSGRNVVIIGAARQGTALARYFAGRGAHVILNDRRPGEALGAAQQALSDLTSAGKVEWVCGGHPSHILDDADLVCLSGGVALTLPLVAEAQRRGLVLSNDSQIFMEAAPCKTIGITGSAGKTTTTTLVGRMASSAVEQNLPGFAGRKIWVGGNIGLPLISLLDQMSPDDLVVMELSSFQLELMSCSPDVAAILNITPNHLDRHATMQAYTTAKQRILDFQSLEQAAILGRDDPGAWGLAGRVKSRLLSFGFTPMPQAGAGIYLDQGSVYLRLPGQPDTHVARRELIALRGDHNLLNVMAACAVAAAAGLPVEAMRAGMDGFSGVPHRLEFVRNWGGADWYNDSIATAPERAMAALRAFDEPLILLAGGRDKDLPWEAFAELVSQRVNYLVLFGEAADVIQRAMSAVSSSAVKLIRCGGLKEAVTAAAEIVRPGDVVLLSPGGTSFDEFNDFEERGRCFVQWVNELA
jgi:UDP-N-acetylmuramoylalanine--D-glutamate ligase